MDKITFSVFRGHPDDSGSPIGEMKEYTVDLDAVSYTHLTLPTKRIV